VIHVHGWMAALLPVYLKHFYQNEGIFADTKIVTSVYNLGFDGTLDNQLKEKLVFDNIENGVASVVSEPTFENIMKLTIDHSDAVVIGSEDLNPTLTKYIESSKKPFLPFATTENIQEVYTSFIKAEVI